MHADESTERSLRAENAELRARLNEAEDMLRAIRSGEVDALVVEGDATQSRVRGEMLAHVIDSVIAVDIEERVTFLNAAAERQYGVRAGDMLGRPITEIFTRHWLSPEAEAGMRTALSERGEWRGDLIHRMPDGRELHVETRATALHDPDGSGSGYIASIRDITERKLAEAELRLSNERFDLAVKCSQAVLWQQDLDLRFTWLHNPAPGIDGSDAVGKREADLLERAEDVAVIEGLKREVIRSGAGMRKEFFPQIQGVVHCFELLMEPLRDAAGHITGLTGAAVDITERKAAEEARRELERQYQALAEASSEVAYRMSADWSTMLPLDGRQLVASSYQSLADWAWLDQNLPREEHPRVRQAISDAIARKTLFELEHRVRRPDGSTGWTFSRAVPILDENKEVIAWFGAASDITERKAAEEALRASEKFNRSLMDGSADCVKVLDVDGRLLQMNASALCLLEIDDFGPLSGEKWSALWPAEAQPDIEHAVATARDGHSCSFQAFCPTAKGTPRWWDVVVSPVRNANDGSVGRLLAVSRDLTERKRAEQALSDHAVTLADLDRRKDAFLATLSHELRNPLGVIGYSLQVLRLMGQDRDAVEQGCARMERQVVALRRLIDDLMDVSRINEDKLTLRTERLDLATVAQSALESSRTALDQRGHPVTVVLPPQPIDVDGDATRLAQVVSNLLINAGKYSDPGSPIELTVERQGDVAALAVRDRGIGIAPADLRRVFELFVQVGGAAHLAQGGLGIGLHLVKRLVELHGGSVEARSDGLGHGSEFLVRLPVASAEARTETLPDHEVLSPSPSRRFRILVADDNEDAVTTLALLLRHLGHDVCTAENGAQAVAVAATFQPEVAVLDIGMPELDGHEACRRIRAQPGGDTMVLIAVSGWGHDEDKRRALNAGFQHHLVKPVDPAALTALLHSLAPT